MTTNTNYIQQLRNKINSYKSYSNEVKQEVLKQLENRAEPTEDQFKTVLKRIPLVMKSAKKYLTKVSKLNKRVEGLEVHAYAPELNKLHLKCGSVYNVPQKKSIKEAVEYLVKSGNY